MENPVSDHSSSVDLSDLSPFFEQRFPIGHQQLSVIQLLPFARRMLQCMLVAECHLVRARHIHQTGGVVLRHGAWAESPVHHVIETEEGLRPDAGVSGAGLDAIIDDIGITHQVHQVGGLGGVGGRRRAAPQVDKVVCPGLQRRVAGLWGDTLHGLSGCRLQDRRLLLLLWHRIWRPEATWGLTPHAIPTEVWLNSSCICKLLLEYFISHSYPTRLCCLPPPCWSLLWLVWWLF